MKTSTKKALTAAIMLTLLSGSVTGVYAASPVAADGTTESADLSNLTGSGEEYLVLADNSGTVNATGKENTSINLTNTDLNSQYAVEAKFGGQINLGDSSTKSINITATGENPTAVMAYRGGAKVNITGDDVHIISHGVNYADGIWAQSNDVNRTNPSAININAKNTVIDVSTDKATFDGRENQAIGIVSYSGSTVNITAI